jgi:hypothetical protein
MSSKNTLHYHVDKDIEAARRARGWIEFHRACGQQGLFFDDIEKEGRGRYSAISIRVEKHVTAAGSELYHRYLVSRGAGKGAIDAVLSAFHAAVAAGFPVDPAHANLFDAPAATPPVGEFDDLIGGSSASTSDEFEDLLG